MIARSPLSRRVGAPLPVAVLACCAALLAGALGSPTVALAFSSSFTAVGGSPGALAVDSTTHRVFVADLSSNTVSMFDGSADDQPLTRVTVGLHPVAIAIDTDLRQVFVADSDSGTVSRLDADDPDPAAAVAVRVDHPSALAVDPVNHIVYVTSSSTNRVFSFDGSPDAPSPALRSIAVGHEPLGVAVDAAAQVVAVTNSGDNTVSLFAARSAAEDSGTPEPVVATVPVGHSPAGVAIDTASHTAVVANLRDNTVSRFDVTATAPTVSTVGVDRAPNAVAIDQTTHYAFVANSLGQTVSQFAVDASAPPVMDVPLGKAPRGVGIDESIGKVFASNPLNGTVSGRAPLTPEAPHIFDDEPYAATVGTWYNHIVEASGTPRPSLTLRGSLPAGLAFDSASGQISGTPTAEEAQTVTIVAHNLAGPDALRTYRIAVNQKAPSLAASGTLALAKVGAAFSSRLSAAGSAPATCSVTGGSLPGGLTLSPAGCALSGKPRTAGTYDFVVTASNSGGNVSGSYQIIVAPSGGGTGCPEVVGLRPDC